MAQYAAMVAAILSVILPTQSLVCRHCLLHETIEVIASDGNCVSCDGHSCSKNASHEEHRDDDHSHDDCPRCVGGMDSTLLLTNSSVQADDLTATSAVWPIVELLSPRWQATILIESPSAVGSPSHPNVLRI
jgi:hypothetical protein